MSKKFIIKLGIRESTNQQENCKPIILCECQPKMGISMSQKCIGKNTGKNGCANVCKCGLSPHQNLNDSYIILFHIILLSNVSPRNL